MLDLDPARSVPVSVRASTRRLLLPIGAILLAAAGAAAQNAFRFDFDVDGVLPSTHPEVTAVMTHLPESVAMTVSGGLLQQRSASVIGYHQYELGTNPGFTPTFPDRFSSHHPLALETRFRVLAVGGDSTYVGLHDEAHRYVLNVSPGGLLVITAAGDVSVPVDYSVFHTYRIESPADSPAFRLLIDGVEVLSVVAPPNPNPAINVLFWGDDYYAGLGSDVDWDYVAVDNCSSTPLVLLDLPFDVDGLLPSADPDVRLYNTTGYPESVLFQVTGGVLQQRQNGVSNTGFYYAGRTPYAPDTPVDVSRWLSLVAETRCRILSLNGTFGAIFQVFDGAYGYRLTWTPTGVDVHTPAGWVSVPIDVAQFHTYRLESPGGSDALRLLIDGVEVFSGSAVPIAAVAAGIGLRDIEWGDGHSPGGNDADVDWDYLRVVQDCDRDTARPTANAGADQAIHAGATVSLDGGDSFDDTTAAADLGYAWTFATRPPGSAATLTGAATRTPSFVADVPGTFELELVVTDEAGNVSDPDRVAVSSDNLLPAADAGENRVLVVGDTAMLDGGGSSDPDGDPLSFLWTLVTRPAGSASMLTGGGSSVTLIPDVPGDYEVTLVVGDGFGSSAPASVTITAISGVTLAQLRVEAACALLRSLPDAAFDARGHRNSLCNQLATVARFLERGDLGQAVPHLDQVLERADGVALRSTIDPKGNGQPHAADFVTDPTNQLAFHALLAEARAAITP